MKSVLSARKTLAGGWLENEPSVFCGRNRGSDRMWADYAGHQHVRN